MTAFESLVERLGHDLRTRFPAIEVRLGLSREDVVCEVLDAEDPWGYVSLVEDFDDELSVAEIEEFITGVVTNITDNLCQTEPSICVDER